VHGFAPRRGSSDSRCALRSVTKASRASLPFVIAARGLNLAVVR
jgi:hypothetical protein